MKPVNVIPPGFLSAFGLKQLGRVPDTMADVLAPVIEMRDWYFQALAQDLTAQATVNVANGAIGITSPLIGGIAVDVPLGKIWRVIEWSAISSALVATDRINIDLGWTMNYPGLGFFYGQSEPMQDVQGAATNRNITRSCRGPFWVPPTGRLNFRVNTAETATNIQILCNLRYVEMQL